MNFPKGGRKKIAWVRVEGVLFRQGALSLAAYLAANAQGFSDRIIKFGIVALAQPLCQLFLHKGDAGLASRLGFFALRDMSEDRVFVLGKEYFDNILRDALLPEGLDLLRRLRREGQEIHLYSESLGCALQYLPPHLKEETRLSCNQLEFSQGMATGKLVAPILGGYAGTNYLLQQAQQEGYDLAHSSAYSSVERDMLLLNAVGNPCAVNPTSALRREARQLDWPIMEY
ncbi:MAG: hypothetical protein U1F66_10770 [bacterium]